MFSNCSIVTDDQAGYSGSHCPSVSWIFNRPSASSFKIRTAVKLLVMLPIWNSVSEQMGPPSCNEVLPWAISSAGPSAGEAHMQADAGKALRFLPLGKVRLDRLLQSGIA